MTRKQILTLTAIMAATIIVASLLKPFKPSEEESVGFDANTNWYKDKATRDKVMMLHPSFRMNAAKFLTDIEKKLGLTALMTSSFRSFESQADLYKENQNNAKPGYSMHNYGFAFDINIKDANGNIILKKADSSEKWKQKGIVDLAKKYEMKWGGDRAFGNYHDPIHFFIEPNGKNSQQLLAIRNAGKVDKAGYVLV